MKKIETTQSQLRPRILYEVAKAAWDGDLPTRSEEICQKIVSEFDGQVNRRQIANQIRVAMGLSPHEDETVWKDNDTEALMGMLEGPIVVADQTVCRDCPQAGPACELICPLGAITHSPEAGIVIHADKCAHDGFCIEHCSLGALSAKAQFVPLIQLLKQSDSQVFASVAPAFAGQFGAAVTPGKLRSSLLKLGFADMIETALYADLITMKEAFEFDEHVKSDDDFMITSCCCPVWIKMIENRFAHLIEHISPSVSPMIASGRVIKTLEPSAKVVFIGPCIAKKSEATLPQLAGAIDFVLTFQELAAIFAAVGINPADELDLEMAVASKGGRIYARTGGVSEAVATTLQKILPARLADFRPIHVDGIPACQKILDEATSGTLAANFIEGMACLGGCAGGPGRLVAAEVSTLVINNYGNAATASSPVENANVYHILTRLGLDRPKTARTVDSPAAALLSRQLQAPKTE